MRRLTFLLLFPFILSAQLKRFEFTQNKMGSPFNVIFYCDDTTKATELSCRCFALVDSLNNIFSDYSSSSETVRLTSISNLNNLHVSDELFQIMLRSKQAWKKSGKAFDITIGALTHLWRQAKRENRFPSETEIDATKNLTGFENIVINKK